MKSLSCTLLVAFLAFGFILTPGCSRIEIQSPAEDGQNVTTPYTLIVEHTGCGTVEPETFEAWLDKDSDAPQEITSAFSYASDIWTALDYNLPMGHHTLSVSAAVTTGSTCYVGSSSDTRTFFVAPCTDFVTAWGEDFELEPDMLFIEYGDVVVEIAQRASKMINLPEDSPLLVDGKLPATVKYGINNTTNKNLKFQVFVRHGEDYLYSKDLVFCGQGVIEEQRQVVLSPSADFLNLTVEAGDILVSPSDDTRPVFFSGKLQVRVYPL